LASIEIPKRAAIRRADRAVFRELSGDAGAVILHLDTGQYHGINEVGRLIWEAIGQGSTLAELVKAVRDQTQGVPANLEGEVAAFVEGLAARSLLIVDDSSIAG